MPNTIRTSFNQVYGCVCVHTTRTRSFESTTKKYGLGNFFLKNNIIGTVSCLVTPDSILKKSIQNTVNDKKDGSKILVIEDGGHPIHIGLKVRDPMRPKGYIFDDPTCFVNINT